MKYVHLLCDGCSDWTIPSLDNRTPMEVADKPFMNALAHGGKVGLCQSVPAEFAPGSDVANLSVLGYPPSQFYTGRSSLEALSVGVPMADGDISLRTNLVTLSDDPIFAHKTLLDYSGGEISTDEAHELIAFLKEHLDDDIHSFHAGVSFRHILLWHGGPLEKDLTLIPAHEIINKLVIDNLPKGVGDDYLISVMTKAYELLCTHPINIKRVAEGKNPANGIWFWGLGTAPTLPNFADRYGIEGSIISAVDLLKGIANGTGMFAPNIPTVTGNIHTDFAAKAEAAIDCLNHHGDYVFIHVEAPDESSHQGSLEDKILSMEKIDQEVLGPVYEWLVSINEDFRIAISPDHCTPLEIRTHARDPIPFAIFDSRFHSYNEDCGDYSFCEKTCKESGIFMETGEELMKVFLNQDFY